MSSSTTLKPGLHEPHLSVKRRVTLVPSILVEQRCCALKRSSVARLSAHKRRSTAIEKTDMTLHSTDS